MSQRAYARHRKESGLVGGTLNAVQKAIAAGRIKLTDGKIDSIQADSEWESNTDEGQRRGSAPAPDAKPPATKAKKEKPAANQEGRRGAGPSLLTTARTDQVQAEANLKRLLYEEKMGRLVPLEDAKREWGNMVAACKIRLLAIPTDFKTKFPDANKAQMMALDKLLRRALEELAAWPPQR